jgi:hypothetical protein
MAWPTTRPHGHRVAKLGTRCITHTLSQGVVEPRHSLTCHAILLLLNKSVFGVLKQQSLHALNTLMLTSGAYGVHRRACGRWKGASPSRPKHGFWLVSSCEHHRAGDVGKGRATSVHLNPGARALTTLLLSRAPLLRLSQAQHTHLHDCDRTIDYFANLLTRLNALSHALSHVLLCACVHIR